MTKLLTWNLQWCGTRTRRYQHLSRAFCGVGADLWCATEAVMAFFPETSNCIAADADYGYAPVPGRRKVVLWSRSGWRDVDTVGHPGLPGGRYVTGTTETAAGALRVIGVCIPWAAAHVSTGRRDRGRWEDHLSYLDGLKQILANTETPCVVLGDFNQAVPRRRAPERVWAALQEAFGPHFRFATEGLTDEEGRHAIDHIAVTQDLTARDVAVHSRFSEDGRPMSDHFGVSCTIQLDSGIGAPAASTNSGES